MAVVVKGNLREVVSALVKVVPAENASAKDALRLAEKRIAQAASLAGFEVAVGSAKPAPKKKPNPQKET